MYSSAVSLVLYVRWSEEPLVWAVERRLNVLVAKAKSGLSAKALLSGVQLMEKLHIIRLITTDIHWMHTRADGKRWARKVSQSRWQRGTMWGPSQHAVGIGHLGGVGFPRRLQHRLSGEWVMRLASPGSGYPC